MKKVVNFEREYSCRFGCVLTKGYPAVLLLLLLLSLSLLRLLLLLLLPKVSEMLAARLQKDLDLNSTEYGGTLTKFIALPHTEGCGRSGGESENMYVRPTTCRPCLERDLACVLAWCGALTRLSGV